MEYFLDYSEIIVIGGGHAGIEAALAAARLSLKTTIITMSLDCVANMPCNPSIGGTAKGQLVKELDALGGEMGKAADGTTIQGRILNKGKGPAVQSLRVQIDRVNYFKYMKQVLETQVNLLIKQDEVVDILVKNGKVFGVKTKLGAIIKTKAVIVACGTFLRGKIFVGDVYYNGGPDGMPNAGLLSLSLKNLGIFLRRFKTGTPARVNKRSIDFGKLEVQYGDENIFGFSFVNRKPIKNMVKCYLAHTNERTHEIIKSNLDKSPLYGGLIEGIGPRYCPSIEDKIVRFSNRTSHQFFIEPVGLNTKEMYLQGLSSSLPESVQIEFLKSIEGLEKVELTRNAYAIEYDCCNSLDLYPTLEFKKIEGLYGAGQFNGTSGYEEAAVQGLVAGVNAARKIRGLGEFILSRSSSYIGTLIDDLVTKGCLDPYRMMTSRSEYRLILRHDNACERLTEIGYNIGLIKKKHYEIFKIRNSQIEEEKARLSKVLLKPTKELNDELEKNNTSKIDRPYNLLELIKRPQLSYSLLEKYDETRNIDLDDEIKEHIEIDLKYEGYIEKQKNRVEKLKRLEKVKLPLNFDYGKLTNISLEAREKLNKIKPINLGQASRISGVSPADVAILAVVIKKNGLFGKSKVKTQND